MYLLVSQVSRTLYYISNILPMMQAITGNNGQVVKHFTEIELWFCRNQKEKVKAMKVIGESEIITFIFFQEKNEVFAHQ